CKRNWHRRKGKQACQARARDARDMFPQARLLEAGPGRVYESSPRGSCVHLYFRPERRPIYTSPRPCGIFCLRFNRGCRFMPNESSNFPQAEIARHHRAYRCIALILQGGGALGAYQAGVHSALLEAGIRPNWLAGISIGSINAAIIAGNPPERQAERLREFWETITSEVVPPWVSSIGDRGAINALSSLHALYLGQKGFYEPRLPPPLVPFQGVLGGRSYYDIRPLKSTLERLIDFDRIHAKAVRLSVGAVNVRTGNFSYFDNTAVRIRPEHIMASAALPPGFPPIEIGGEFYWDGGLVSNTPLQYVLDFEPRMDTLAFQVDLGARKGRSQTISARCSSARRISVIPAALATTPIRLPKCRRSAAASTGCSQSSPTV